MSIFLLPDIHLLPFLCLCHILILHRDFSGWSPLLSEEVNNCTLWLSRRAGQKNIWLEVMKYLVNTKRKIFNSRAGSNIVSKSLLSSEHCVLQILKLSLKQLVNRTWLPTCKRSICWTIAKTFLKKVFLFCFYFGFVFRNLRYIMRFYLFF